jgi:hypothetical protein
VPDLEWHYGPTDANPDPGSRWHDECGGRVDFLEGAHVCDCGAQDTITDDEIPARVEAMWRHGWTNPDSANTFVLLLRELVSLRVDPLDAYRILDQARLAVAHEYGG